MALNFRYDFLKYIFLLLVVSCSGEKENLDDQGKVDNPIERKESVQASCFDFDQYDLYVEGDGPPIQKLGVQAADADNNRLVAFKEYLVLYKWQSDQCVNKIDFDESIIKVVDLNGDACVDIEDYDLLMDDIGKSIENSALSMSDLDGDGKVEFRDYAALIENWGAGCADLKGGGVSFELKTDINSDGCTDDNDLNLVRDNFGLLTTRNHSKESDVDGDGIISYRDYFVVFQKIENQCSVYNEPGNNDSDGNTDFLADINSDGCVNYDDQNVLLSSDNYHLKIEKALNPEADINGDGTIDITDNNLLAKNWLQGCTDGQQGDSSLFILGDVNGDHCVDRVDYDVVISVENFTKNIDDAKNPEADFDKDGFITIEDYSIVLQRWSTGVGCGTTNNYSAP